MPADSSGSVSPDAAAPPIAPISSTSAERVVLLDVLRGMALLGMFVVHFHVHTGELGGFQDLVRTLVWRLVESKSHGTFALLFGAGFAIQLRRAQARGAPFATRYLRRLLVLAGFGLIAHGVFGYNVLVSYALMGVPLLVLHRLSTRALITTALLLTMTVPIYTMAWRAVRGDAALQARQVAAVEVNAAVDAAAHGPSYRALLAARLRHMNWFHSQPFFLIPGATLALFLVGLLMIRHGVFERPREHRRVLVLMIVLGAITWALADWGADWTGWIGRVGLLRDQWLTLTYVGAALLVLGEWPSLATRLRPVAQAGRMALTNYLLQIAAIDLIFSGYAVGLGSIKPTTGLLAAIGCFATEAAISTWWLRRFRYGPAEWVWRWLTYGHMPPMGA